ncbi:MAG: D-proline reductase (dithiol) PrdB [Gammaproteobacteria bacterium]|jgi:D-proline reductase (dithiol) PrdB
MTEHFDDLQFAQDFDTPIRYMDRISTYYQTLGFGKPYRWAQYAEVPFTPLSKPLAQSRVALITTAAPYQADKGDQGPGAPYNSAAKFYRVYTDSIDGAADVRISHVGIDRKHTSAVDKNTWLPLKALKKSAQQGQIGELSPRFYGAPTNRSQRATIDQDCADILREVRDDHADLAVLAAN